MLKTGITLIPTDELTLTDQRKYRQDALDSAEIILRDKIGAIGDYIARPAQNIADFTTVLEQWNTAPLLVVGGAYSVFQAVAAPVLGNRQMAVFYKVGVETPGLPVSQIIFQEGAAGRTTYAVLDLEQLYCKVQTEGYLSEPVVYLPGSVLRITVICRIFTGVFCRVPLGCYIIEPAGPQISG